MKKVEHVLRTAQRRPARLSSLARQYARLHGGGSADLWRWARDLLRFATKAGETLTLDRIADVVGRAVRGKPYHRAFALRVLRAAREWPRRPQTEDERRAFVATFYGREGGKSADDKRSEVSKSRALAALGRAVARCVALGFDDGDIRGTVEKSLVAARAAARVE